HQPVRRIKTLYETQRAPVRAMAFTPNHEYLVTASGNTLTRWNLSDYSSTQLTRVQGVIHSLACGGTGSSPRMLIGGTRAGGGFVMSIQGNDIETENVPLPVYSVAISADGTRYAIPQGNKVLYGRDGRNQPFVLTTPSAVRAVAISPNGAKIAAGGSDGKITVWTVGQPTRPPAVARTPPNFRIQARILDQQTQKLLPKATITPRGGPGRCNPLEWKPTPASHYFEMLSAGTYQFRVTCPGYKTRDFQLKTGNQELKYDLKMIRDVAPPKPTPKPPPKPTPTISPILLLVQHQDGTPVNGPKIQLIAGPGQVTPKGEQPRGTHRFEATKAGEYRFDISKPGYTSQMVAASPDGRPNKITLHRKFTLLLTILDPDQKPVAKPRIVVTGAGKETKLASSGAIHSYSLSAEGVYEVTVSKAGFKQQTFNVDVRKQYTAKKITLRYGLQLAIAVVDSGFKAIDRPTIDITPPDKARKLSTKGAVHTYSFKSDGRYQFKVSKEGFVSQTKTFDLSTGEGKNTFKLRAVEYELVVRVPKGGDLDVHAPKGSVVTRRVDAAYALWLPRGVYKVAYTNIDEFTFEQQVTIKSANAELKFELDPFPEARKFHREMDTNGDGKLTKEDFATSWDQIRKTVDQDGNGELTVEEIATQFNMLGQAKETPATTTTLPATSRAQDVRRTLDTLPGSGSGWAKKDLDPETWKFFEKLDADGNEVIDTNEQKRLMDAMESQAIADTVNDSDATGVPSALLSLRRRLRRLDKNSDGFGRTDVTEDAWLWLFRNYDKNTNDKLDASEELAFQTEFQQVATEHVQGKALIEALRSLFRKRDKDGNGVGDDEVDAPSWQVLKTYDTEPRNGRIDRNAEETRFLQDYQAKLIELLKLLVEAGDQPATPPANNKAAHLRATMKQFDTKGDGLDTTDVAADTWSMLFAKFDTDKNGRLDATETDKWVKEWEKWTEEPVAEPDAKDAVKRRVLTVRKIGSR
ncbi:MAG: hypothetical protein ACYS0F_06790, partial [Planctomycetota bacterium]